MDFVQIPAGEFNPTPGNQTRVPDVAIMMNMKSLTRFLLTLTLSVGMSFGIRPITAMAQAPGNDQQTAVFSGGCFWGVDAVFKHVKGGQHGHDGSC
jgi:hypothetical protein